MIISNTNQLNKTKQIIDNNPKIKNVPNDTDDEIIIKDTNNSVCKILPKILPQDKIIKHTKLYNLIYEKRESYLTTTKIPKNIFYTLIVDGRERVSQSNYQEFAKIVKNLVSKHSENCESVEASIPVGDFLWIMEDEKDDKVS